MSQTRLIGTTVSYFYYYEPYAQIICGVAVIALLFLWYNVKKKQSAPKAKLVAAGSILFVVGQFLYFHFQLNTPHYLFLDYKEGARVDISEIVSVETSRSGSTKTYYLFQLSNGSTLKCRKRDTDVYSKKGRELRYINVLDITDWK